MVQCLPKIVILKIIQGLIQQLISYVSKESQTPNTHLALANLGTPM